MDRELSGTTALVTASSKGLGRAVATEFVSQGATVAICSRSESNLRTARDHIVAETGVGTDRVVTTTCDLSEPATVAAAVEDSIEELGGLDYLVTNHPSPPTIGFEEASLRDLRRACESILESTFVTVKTALPHLERDGGSITNLVSGSVREPTAGSFLSNVVRPGLFSFSKVLANEYGGDGVRVNCVCPRGIETDRLEEKIESRADREAVSFSEAKARRVDEIPLDRLGTPEEFARDVVFVASDASGFVHGAVLQIDGGWSRNAF